MSFELFGVGLLDPWFLLAIPAAILAALWRLLRPRAAAPTAAVALFGGAPVSLRQRLRWVPLALQLLAAACLAVALARPVEREVVPIREQGVDILLVVDTSSSMSINDMSETEREMRRIDAARARDAYTIGRVPGDVVTATEVKVTFDEPLNPPVLDDFVREAPSKAEPLRPAA